MTTGTICMDYLCLLAVKLLMMNNCWYASKKLSFRVTNAMLILPLLRVPSFHCKSYTLPLQGLNFTTARLQVSTAISIFPLKLQWLPLMDKSFPLLRVSTSHCQAIDNSRWRSFVYGDELVILFWLVYMHAIIGRCHPTALIYSIYGLNIGIVTK